MMVLRPHGTATPRTAPHHTTHHITLQRTKDSRPQFIRRSAEPLFRPHRLLLTGRYGSLEAKKTGPCGISLQSRATPLHLHGGSDSGDSCPEGRCALQGSARAQAQLPLGVWSDPPLEHKAHPKPPPSGAMYPWHTWGPMLWLAAVLSTRPTVNSALN